MIIAERKKKKLMKSPDKIQKKISDLIVMTDTGL